MSQVLHSVRLLGENTTNPGVPNENISGDLVSDSSSLQFISNDESVRYHIPWDSIDKCEVETEGNPGMGTMKAIMIVASFGLFVGGLGTSAYSLTLLSLLQMVVGAASLYCYIFVLSTNRTLIVIKHWNEEHGYDATIRFFVGNFYSSYSKAHEIVREIWGVRGGHRSHRNAATRVRVR